MRMWIAGAVLRTLERNLQCLEKNNRSSAATQWHFSTRDTVTFQSKHTYAILLIIQEKEKTLNVSQQNGHMKVIYSLNEIWTFK
jgi:hypothetical protein